MKIELEPVAYVRGGREQPLDDDWLSISADIVIDNTRFDETCVAELETFSHLVIVYYFHQVTPEKIVSGARHPRGNQDWPKAGIFAQRAKNRPNQLAVSHCRLLGVDGLTLKVQGLDAIDGTPVLDIKPYMIRFEPQGRVSEPDWAKQIMTNYW